MTVNTSQRSVALKIVRNVNSELASASLSYLPGDQPGGTGSFSSDAIIASIKQLPGGGRRLKAAERALGLPGADEHAAVGAEH